MDVAYGLMIRYVLESADVSAVRFGISPLGEVGLGLRALRVPDALPLQRPWLDRIAPSGRSWTPRCCSPWWTTGGG